MIADASSVQGREEVGGPVLRDEFRVRRPVFRRSRQWVSVSGWTSEGDE